MASISNGAIVEKKYRCAQWQCVGDSAVASGRLPTSARIAKQIDTKLGGQFAHARDSGTVEVKVPKIYRDRMVEFLALIERFEVTPDSHARVVINERTGTIIMGQDVRIDPVAVAHGNITVSINTNNQAVPAGAPPRRADANQHGCGGD